MSAPDTPHCLRCGASSWLAATPHDRHGGEARQIRVCASAVCGIGFTWRPPDDLVQAAPAAGELRGVAAALAQRMAAASVEAIANALPPGALVVAGGAGTGLRARALADRGFRVVALEPDPLEEMRAHVELTGTTVEIHRAGIDDLADVLDGQQADGVLMWHVLEHLEMPDTALGMVSSAMRDGGLLGIAVPNRESLEAQVFGDRWHAWEPSRHRWHFDERALRLVLGEAGFSVRDISPRGGWGYPASLAFSLAPGLDPQVHGRHALAGRAFATAMIPAAFGARAAGRGSQLVTLASRT